MNRYDHLCALQFATMILVWNPMKLDIFDYIFFLAVHNADKPYQEILLYRLFER